MLRVVFTLLLILTMVIAVVIVLIVAIVLAVVPGLGIAVAMVLALFVAFTTTVMGPTVVWLLVTIKHAIDPQVAVGMARAISHMHPVQNSSVWRRWVGARRSIRGNVVTAGFNLIADFNFFFHMAEGFVVDHFDHFGQLIANLH